MKKRLILSALSFAITFAGTNALAGGGGSGWTQCYIKELGLSYNFSGYTQSLTAGKVMTVFTSTTYGHYRIDSIVNDQPVGVIKLSYVPDSQKSTNKDTNYGRMKIEYFSNSALKDIKVTFLKDGHTLMGNTTCMTN